MRKMIVASSSAVIGSPYLEYISPVLKEHFKDVEVLCFIPYARPSGINYDVYTQVASKAFKKIGIKVVGLHEFDNPTEAIAKSQAIFTGGGNTFELVKQLYQNNVLTHLKKAIDSGVPYLGTSAGSTICGLTMKNTNDMPIVEPPSYKTLGCFDFNLNTHYFKPEDHLLITDGTKQDKVLKKHMLKGRETKIKEFHHFNNTPVLGLREGSWLEVLGDKITLRGEFTARLFRKNQKPIELSSDQELDI